MMHCRGRNKLAVDAWRSGKKKRKKFGVCECVSLTVCVFVPLLECVFREVGGHQLLYIHGEMLGGAVLPWLSQARTGGSGSGVICRCVLVGVVKVERLWQGGWFFLLEKDALSFLHPRVVFHQLRVQERILGDAILYPLYQTLWRDREGQRHFLNSRGSL